MKVTVKTTETKTSEVNVSFPTFTKYSESALTYYYAVLSENELYSVNEYATLVGTIDVNKSCARAFREGFEFIDEKEFTDALNRVKNEFVSNYNSMSQTFEDLKKEAKAEQERDNYFEYQDEARAERDEHLAQFETED